MLSCEASFEIYTLPAEAASKAIRQQWAPRKYDGQRRQWRQRAIVRSHVQCSKEDQVNLHQVIRNFRYFKM
jgi:hypothetical protein